MKSIHDFRGEARAANRRLQRAVRQGARVCDTRSLAREAVYADAALANAEDTIAEQRKAYLESRGIHVNDSGRYRDEDRSVLFCFGAYGSTYVLAFGHLETALEDAAETLREVAPGLFCDDAVTEAYDEARAVAVLIQRLARDWGDDLPEEIECLCMEHAEVDTTHTEAGYLLSYEWSIVGEDLTWSELKEIAKERT